MLPQVALHLVSNNPYGRIAFTSTVISRAVLWLQMHLQLRQEDIYTFSVPIPCMLHKYLELLMLCEKATCSSIGDVH